MYKVGDKVRIKKRIGEAHSYRSGFIDTMAELAGSVCTIASAIKEGCAKKHQIPDDGYIYRLKEHPLWRWVSSEFEPINDDMRLSDLQLGMVIECRNGIRYIVADVGQYMFVNENDWITLDTYTEDMTYTKNHDFDIVKVYNPSEFAGIRHTRLSCQNPIWERNDSITLTMQEIADKFNISVEQLKIKR